MIPALANAVEEEIQAPEFFRWLEVKANLGRTIIAVDKKVINPVYYAILVDKKHTKVYSKSIKKGLWLKPRDIIDLWTSRKTKDGFYVADQIVLRKRPQPTEEDIRLGGNPGRVTTLDRFRLIPVEEITGRISKVIVDTKYQNIYIFGPHNQLWYVSRTVTGKIGWRTPRGNFSIRAKERKRYIEGTDFGEDYRFWVEYWMPFAGGAGLHDAYWRYTFWVNHHYNGSHGCVNLPWATAKFIYDHSKVGTPVIVR